MVVPKVLFFFRPFSDRSSASSAVWGIVRTGAPPSTFTGAWTLVEHSTGFVRGGSPGGPAYLRRDPQASPADEIRGPVREQRLQQSRETPAGGSTGFCAGDTRRRCVEAGTVQADQRRLCRCLQMLTASGAKTPGQEPDPADTTQGRRTTTRENRETPAVGSTPRKLYVPA